MKLQVPEQMAGVTGPCPQCSATIIAPQPKPPMAAEPIPSPQTEPAPTTAATPTAAAAPATAPMQQQVQQPQQQQQVPTQQQVPSQPMVHTQPQVQQQSMQQQPSPISSSQVSQPTSHAAPQPAAAPVQPESRAVSQAPMVEKVRRQSHAGPRRRSRWMRVVFPLAFILIAIVLVLVVLNAAGFLNLWNLEQLKAKILGEPATNNKPAATAPATIPSSATIPSAQPPAEEPKNFAQPPGDSTPKPSVAPPVVPPVAPPAKPVSIPTTPTATPAEGEFPDLTPPTPTVSTSPPEPEPVVDTGPANVTSPDIESPPKAGSLVKEQRFLANEILDKFLNAESLDERLSLMAKSKYSPEELAQSCLAGKLKPVKSNYFAEMVPRLEDDMRQYRYYVAFEDEKEARDRQLMVLQVVERPGIHPPRVNGDAFIEHYEKKLDFYGLNPNKDATTFHCIAEARTADLAKNLPEELKRTMIRLVVKTHPRGKPAFDAFLSKNSPLMERIGPRGDFPYVEARFCILTFRWNTTHPKQPFIELIDIVTMGWEK